ncbi:hypothetical protein IG631_20028 [Alternaria alternata]|nr:hypothetical protein IG631_20028 [Alternaria alternata]
MVKVRGRLKGYILTVLRGELLAFLPQPHAWLRHAGVLLSLCRASFSSEITVVSSFVALPVRSAIRGGFGSGSGFEHVKRTPDVAVGDGSGVAIVRNTSARRATCCNDNPSRRSHAGAHGPLTRPPRRICLRRQQRQSSSEARAHAEAATLDLPFRISSLPLNK